MSDTSPSELSAILANDTSFRLYVVKKLEEASADRREIIANQKSHEKEDSLRFAEGDKRMERLEVSIDGKKGVRSGVNEFEAIKYQFQGGWKALAGLVVIGAAGWTILQGLAWFVEKLKP